MLKWLANYQKNWLRADLLAGLTAAAVVIPKAMAYAVIAGLPVSVGLYTALMGMLIYPLLGSSRVLSVTTTSAIAMLTAAQIAISSTVLDSNPLTVATTLALLVAGMLLLAWLLRLGFLANFISKPVLIGFEAGIGVVILVGQLKSVLGLHLTSQTTIGTLFELSQQLTQTHLATLGLAMLGSVLLIGLPRLWPQCPAALLWVGLSIAASAALDLDAYGIQLIGSVPSGLPAFAWPDLTNLHLLTHLSPAALGIALMCFTESVAAARTFSQPHDPPINPNQELLALAAANLGAAVAGGLPAGGGASQTAVIEAAGARSQLAQWVNGFAVLLTLLFLARSIALLPQAALGVMILLAAVQMIQPQAFRALARIRPDELLWALATLIGVIVLGTLPGILIAVAISILTLFYQANHPPVYAVAYNRAQGIFRRLGEATEDETFPGLLILRTEGRLSFANVSLVAEKMQILLAQTQPRVIVLECSAILDLEYTALELLTQAEQNLRARGITLWLAGLNPAVHRILMRAPLGTCLGSERIFHTLAHALAAWHEHPDSTDASKHS